MHGRHPFIEVHPQGCRKARGMRGGRRHGYGPEQWGGGGRRRRMRRGDVRAAILVLLAEQPFNGYGLMQEVEERSGGDWRPSPGSVYPALQQLEDEGLVRPEEHEGRKAFALTDEGRAYVEEHRERLGEPWKTPDDDGGGDDRRAMRDLVGQLAAAAIQVAKLGDDRQAARAVEILTESRRALYRVLADDDEASEDTPQA